MYRIMFQVISVVDGIFRHEGFFCGEQQAHSMRDLVAKEMEYAGINGEVFINEIKR